MKIKEINLYKKFNFTWNELLFFGSQKILKPFLHILPDIFHIFLGKIGFTYLIKNSQNIKFTARCYATNYKILVRSDYLIETAAGSILFRSNDVIHILKKLKINGSILDIGANSGTISIGAVGLGAKKIYAIEPGLTFERLVNNIKLNKLENVIEAYQIGFAKKEGQMYWAQDFNHPGNAHLINAIDELNLENLNTNFGSNKDLIEVKVNTLDNFANEIGIKNLKLIKIDVEGMEWEVIASGTNLIKSTRPFVIAETHRTASEMMNYDCLTKLFYFFYENNYSSFYFDFHEGFKRCVYPNFKMDTIFIPNEVRRNF